MHPLSAAELLHIWEIGQSQSYTRKALLVLMAAFPNEVETLAQMPIGERDSKLLSVREALFGRDLISMALCESCGERLELAFRTSDIHASVDYAEQVDSELKLEVARHHVLFRLPNSVDLEALEASRPTDAQAFLLEKCIVKVTKGKKRLASSELPEEVAEAVMSKMAEIDPQAEVQIALTCPACQNDWLAPFDILTFLWQELTAWAQRMIQEVHVLASVYGWPERAILEMTPLRRKLYLDQIRHS